MNIPWTCPKYIQAPHISNCCRTCGRTKEAHELYEKFKDETVAVIWNGKRISFKDAEEMIKNRFFPG